LKQYLAYKELILNNQIKATNRLNNFCNNPQYLSFNLKQIFHSRVIAPVFAADVAVAVDQNYQKKQLVALMILISE